MLTRDNVKLVLVAVFCLAIGLAAPSTAAAVKKGLNADKVDGLHAVKAKASVAKRAKKLVATDAAGYLPGDIVKKVPSASTADNASNADKVGGVTAAQLRSFPVMASDLLALNGATKNASGVSLPDAGNSGLALSFPLPADYTKGNPVSADIVFAATGANCGIFWSTQGAANDPVTGLGGNHPWHLPNGTDNATVNAGPVGPIRKLTITLAPPYDVNPGSVLAVSLLRGGSLVEDTCTSVEVAGATIRY